MNDKTEDAVRQPSMLDALIPMLFMIVLLSLSIILFGIDATVGPLQVSLLMSAVVAAVVAHKNGHSWEKLGDEIVKGISLRGRHPDLADGWGADRGLEYVRHDRYGYLLRHQIHRSDLVLPGSCPAHRDYQDRHRQLLDHCGYSRRGVYRYGNSNWRSLPSPLRQIIEAYFGDKMTPVGDDHFDTANRGQQRVRPYPQHGQGHCAGLLDLARALLPDRPAA